MSSVKEKTYESLFGNNKRRSSTHTYENTVELVSVKQSDNYVAVNEGLGEENAEVKKQEDEMDILTPGDLIAFAWQISKGMVSLVL